MRLLWISLLLVGCGRQNQKNGYLGESEGTIAIDGTDRRFDGGALELEVEGDRIVVVTTHGWHFTCEWAQSTFGTQGGPNVDRQGQHWDLVWMESLPDEVALNRSKQGLFGGGSGGTVAILDAEVSVDEDGNGEFLTDRGDVAFQTFDCNP